MLDVYGLGNALVDMEFQVDDGFLRQHEIPKGHMTLVEEERLDALIEDLHEHQPERMSGGSAANTIIAAQYFGASTYYSCKVANDETGQFFVADLNAAGVRSNADNKAGHGKSGRCLVLVTKDAERSMNTFLGASSDLSIHDIDEAALTQARYFYVEGYLSSNSNSRDAAIAGRELAEQAGVKTVVSLSDPSMVEFFRGDIEQMLGNGVHHLFCNEEEALTWAKTDRLDIALKELTDIAQALNITLGKRGSIAATAAGHEEAPGYSVQAVDTNGAGDIYAGASLFGWCAGMSAGQAAAFGNLAAAALVQSYGARFRRGSDYRDVLTRFKRG